jgi:hypothetical protein
MEDFRELAHQELLTGLEIIKMKLELVLEQMDKIYTPIKIRWLTEPQTMKILNLNKRGMEVLRSKHVIRTSSATGRNFLYYVPDIENYIYDHSAVKKRRKNPNRLYKKKKPGEDGRKRE